MNTPASAHCPFRRATVRPWLAGVLCATASCLPLAVGLHAAQAAPASSSSSVDNLISKLPDPSQFSKSPLEAAVEDRAETTPEYRRIVFDMQRHNYPAALAESRTLAARYPDSHPKIHLIHGFLAMLAKQYGEADKAFHILVAVAPTHGIGWLALARIQELQRNYPGALVDVKKSVAVEPTYTSGWLGIATCEYHLHHLPEAAAAAHHATQINPRSAGAWYALGRYEVV